MQNPLLKQNELPYNVKPFHQIKTEHFEEAFEQALSEARNEVKYIIENDDEPDFSNTIEALEMAGKKLTEIAKVFFNLNVAATSDEMQKIAAEISPVLSDFKNSITLNEDLFSKVNAVYSNCNRVLLAKDQNKLLEDTYNGFIRSGANLDAEAKKEYQRNSARLAELQVNFNKHVLSDTHNFFMLITQKHELEGLPEDVVNAAKKTAEEKEKEGWMFTLQHPSFGPFLKYSSNRTRREEIWQAHATRCLNSENSNIDIVKEIANLRFQQANLLGFKNFAGFVLEKRMAKTPDKVNSFLNDLLVASLPLAQKDKTELEKIAPEFGIIDEIKPWDINFLIEKLKIKHLNFDDEVTRPFFALNKVLDGIFKLAGQLYNLDFTEDKSIPVYDKEVKVYKVSEGDKLIALLYLDFFPRENKQGGAWMTDFQEQSNVADAEIRPHISLVFNFTKPLDNKPSLLTHVEVTTLLHEFGHALHGMLSDVRYASQAGTNVYRDFVELPSQFFENYAYEKEWLVQLAEHYKTGEKIPEDLMDNIIQSRTFFEGYATLRQISFGMLDMAWHTFENLFDEDVIEFEQKATQATRLFSPVPNTGFSTAFSHIFGGGYASGYYGYKWAEVLDADAFEKFKEQGIFNKKLADLFRNTILSKGGTDDPMKLYKKFMGREPKVDALLKRMGKS